MNRVMSGLGLTIAALLAGFPGSAEAQLVVNVGLHWESGEAPRGGYRLDERPFGRVHVPPGHLPRRGYCKVWFPGRPPGHQPPASKCERMIVRHRTVGVAFGSAGFADALLLVGPDRRIPVDSRDVRFVDDYDDRAGDRHRGRGKGRRH